MTRTYVLDGTRIHTLDDFWHTLGSAINGPGGYFGRNLDALVDCLRGGFGTPDDGDYLIEWHHHDVSREHLGHPETTRQLELRLARCHPTNRSSVLADLTAAREGRGDTVYDWLLTTFESHAPGVLRLR
ncbi:barstar family protein [Streptomyces acidiscabies]|uniref:Barnase inhibitor n=1 Tax=Streptomyces acidiscabies TaxID=42234 RepID=A0A0L0K167_9ACTN|nr:barstar family protein [Streptomyces acidiscabies]KND31494.1 barnase inhibitor [Streptomyces acidiscabies]